MPLDGICMQAVAEELRSELLGLRIDKVQQPARDQVILLLRGNKRLLLNAGANTPRIQLTALTRDNPAEPPMFCMLLRKHLMGGRILSVEQPHLERIVELRLEVLDELGDLTEVAALEQGIFSGVEIVASVHAATLEDALQRPQVRVLQQQGALRFLVLLEGRCAPGRIREIRQLPLL